MKSDYTIILFYKYVHIENPEQLRLDQIILCTNLNMKGRTIIAHEGINGTFEGPTESIEKYIEIMKSDERFADVDFKTSPGTGEAFPKLKIKVRDEIVTTNLGSDDVDPNQMTGYHMTPEELYKTIHSDEKYYIVDMRNDYEQEVGMFHGSIRSGMKNFRDLAETAKKLSDLKDEKIITVCTGGIRCEKASGYLIKKGFKNVSQLKGGMHRYLEAFDGEDFDGRLYVFDNRVTMDPFKKHTVIGRCFTEGCEIHTEKYFNCANKQCNKHILCCTRCRYDENTAFCCDMCKNKVLNQKTAV